MKTKAITAFHPDDVSGMTFFGSRRIALWTEGRSSWVDLFEMDESFKPKKRSFQVSSSGYLELQAAIEEGESRPMTETEELLYDILRNLASPESSE